ncbi:MAG: hypothetical protein MJ168_07270 [Clostridia bacterium]|nr:hypothetical protein [Clostridia bacterium]
MNQLVFTVAGNRLSLNEEVYSTGGSVNYDKCRFTFDSSWNGYERTAVFGVGRDTYRVPLDSENTCFIPSPCMAKEGIITIGVFGTKDDSVIATNAVSHHIEEGVDGLGEWFEEDYSLVLNAINTLEDKTARCINDLNENFDAVMRSIRRNGTVIESKGVSDCPDEWYKPDAFEGAETLGEITLGESINGYFDYKFNALRDDFPSYVRRERIGSSSSGEIPVYSYVFEPLNYEKTMIVTGCTHGCEDMIFFALATFFDDLCRKSETDRTLAYLKNRVKFIVIPAINPYSLVSGDTYNENDVDIGSNFPYKWAECTKNKKGSSAGDQAETQNIIEYVDMIQLDKLCAAVDFHASSVTVSGKAIFYPRYKDNCLSALSEFLGRFNPNADGIEAKGVLAPSINPTLSNYLADTYGINTCEAVWPYELYGDMYSSECYDKLIEFVGNLLYTMAKNSNIVNRCSSQPFTKYLSWRGNDDAFNIPVSVLPNVMGISNYNFELSSPCIITLTGYVVLNVNTACTVKILPLLYQDNSPLQTYQERGNVSELMHNITLTQGIHVIPVSSILQAYYSSYNDSSRTLYSEKVTCALAFATDIASSAEVQAYSLTLSGIPSDKGKCVEFLSPMGNASDYRSSDVPTQRMIYPIEKYLFSDSRYRD